MSEISRQKQKRRLCCKDTITSCTHTHSHTKSHTHIHTHTHTSDAVVCSCRSWGFFALRVCDWKHTAEHKLRFLGTLKSLHQSSLWDTSVYPLHTISPKHKNKWGRCRRARTSGAESLKLKVWIKMFDFTRCLQQSTHTHRIRDVKAVKSAQFVYNLGSFLNVSNYNKPLWHISPLINIF